tara:strand:+ start:8641 stop:9684 length:1044 start_codon:yes stop_codon:yes gene_type:complete
MAPRLGLGGGVTANPASGLFASTPLLLDTYPNAHRAYSVRKLRTDYTGYAMKVRNDDDETADIAFNDNGIVAGDSPTANLSGGSGATLDAFVTGATGSANEGYVDTWYDQSGEGSNATSNAPGEQPRIYDGGSLVTSGSGGTVNTAVKFVTDSDVADTSFLQVSNSGLSIGNVSVFWVSKVDLALSYGAAPIGSTWWLSDGSTEYCGHLLYSSGDEIFYSNLGLGSIKTGPHEDTTNPDPPYPGGPFAGGGPSAAFDYLDIPRIFSFNASTSSQTISHNGTAGSHSGSSANSVSFAGTASNQGIGHHSLGGNYSHNGPIQEFIVYDSNQSSNDSGIVANINAAFNHF